MTVLPDFPSLVAVTTTRPTAIAVTWPACVTLTFELSALDHVTVWPMSTAPFESRKLADSWADPPGINSDESGATTTDATAGGVTPVGCSLPPPHDATNDSDPIATQTVVRVRDNLRMRFCRRGEDAIVILKERSD